MRLCDIMNCIKNIHSESDLRNLRNNIIEILQAGAKCGAENTHYDVVIFDELSQVRSHRIEFEEFWLPETGFSCEM